MVTLLQYFHRKLKAHHVDAYSAQAAFFLLCSLVPLLLLLFASAKVFSVSEEAIMDSLYAFFPPPLSQWISDIVYGVYNRRSGGTTIFSAITVIWSASKCIYYIIGGLNTIFEVKERRRFWVVRLLSILYTFAFIFAVIFTVMLMIFGSYIIEQLSTVFPISASYLSALLAARHLIGILVLSILFSFLFKSLPAEKHTFGDMFPGAIVSSVGWILFSSLFGLYIERYANYSNLYGGLTSIVLFMLWLYICMQILFFGAELNLLIRKLR